MTTFAFRAVDLTGQQVKGELDGDSKQAVTDQLKSRGLVALDIDDTASSIEIDIPFLNSIKRRDITVFTRQISTMISSGMPLLRALYVLEEQTEAKRLQAVIVDVRKDVEAGQAFSKALERHPKAFQPLYVSMVAAGETGGMLDATLLRVADQLESEDSLRRQVKTAMAYPSVIISIAIVVLLALIAFIVPVFEKIFKDFGGELPAITKLTIAMSHAITDRWYLVFLSVVGGIYAFRRWKRSEWGRAQWDRFRLRVPLKIGDIVQKVALARWSRTLSALISGGVPILEAIEVTGRTAGNTVVERAMASVTSSVKSGGTISAALANEPIFPGMVTHMVAVGEETGALDTMLSKVADFYEDEVNAAVKALTSILEPAMIIFVGAIVGFIIISMYLPMFTVYDNIR